jgi:hypothetical protein
VVLPVLPDKNMVEPLQATNGGADLSVLPVPPKIMKVKRYAGKLNFKI